MSSVAMDALAHGALEGGVGPGADPGLEIGRDVGAVDDPERCLERPAAGVLSLTVVLILFFLIDGTLMITSAIEHRREATPRWAWMLAGGIVDLALGGIFLAGMPGTFTWAPSVLVGFDLLVAGGALMAMALSAQSA